MHFLNGSLGLLVSGFLLAGCGNHKEQQATVETQRQELAQLRSDNEELKKLEAGSKELDRLRRDNQEVQKLRDDVKGLAQLKLENARLKGQSTADLEAAAAGAQAGQSGAAVSGVAGAPGASDGVGGATQDPQVAQDPNLPQEGDEIMVDPKQLKLLMPEFDWDKLKRTEPVGVKALLESRGISLTNYQQLNEMGVTNYQIVRNPPNADQNKPQQQ